MSPKQTVFLVIAILFLVCSVLPAPIIEKAAVMRSDQIWWARLCLASMGVMMILTLHTVG